MSEMKPYENLLSNALDESRNEVAHLRQQLSAVQGELDRARLKTAELQPVFDLAVEFYIAGDAAKLIDYMTANVDLEGFLARSGAIQPTGDRHD